MDTMMTEMPTKTTGRMRPNSDLLDAAVIKIVSRSLGLSIDGLATFLPGTLEREDLADSVERVLARKAIIFCMSDDEPRVRVFFEATAPEATGDDKALAPAAYPEPKAPIQLCPKGTETVVAWACGSCGTVKHTPERATACCACWHCGKRIAAGLLAKTHKACSEAADAERYAFQDREQAVKEARHLLAVTPILAANYSDPVFWNDHLVMDANEVEDELDVDQAIPAFVFGSTRHTLRIDAEAALENALEQDEMHEGAGDSVSADAKAALKKALDAWNEEHGSTVESYMVDRSAVVVLNQEAFDAALKEASGLLAHVMIVKGLAAALYMIQVRPEMEAFVWTYKPWISGAWWSKAS